MKECSLWRQSRKRRVYRQVVEGVSDGMYAFSLIRVESDDTVDVTIDEERIVSNMEPCIRELERLLGALREPASVKMEYCTIVEELGLSQSGVSYVIQTLEDVLASRQVDEQVFEEVYDWLREVERFAKRHMERTIHGSSW